MHSVRVIKIGGSLLSFDALVPALRDWLAAEPPARNVLLVGGGAFTNHVRDCDRRFGFDPAQAHWLCIRLLDVNTRMLSLLLPDATFVDRFEPLQEMLANAGREGLWLFSPEEFLQRFEPQVQGAKLPADWTATSDSIAARVAAALLAVELVLVKSADPPRASDAAQLAREGYVDEFFPQASRNLPAVRYVNLRG